MLHTSGWGVSGALIKHSHHSLELALYFTSEPRGPEEWLSLKTSAQLDASGSIKDAAVWVVGMRSVIGVSERARRRRRDGYPTANSDAVSAVIYCLQYLARVYMNAGIRWVIKGSALC